MVTDPMPKLCSHDDPMWCTEECREKARAFDEWLRRHLPDIPEAAFLQRGPRRWWAQLCDFVRRK